MFRKLLENEIERRGLSVREAADQVGVSHTTIYQIIKGRPVDLETANKVCKWLGISIASAVDDPATNDTIAATISVILRHVPELGAVFTEAAKELEAGTMTEEDFQAVVEFAAFQIQKRKEQAKKNVRSEDLVKREETA